MSLPLELDNARTVVSANRQRGGGCAGRLKSHSVDDWQCNVQRLAVGRTGRRCAHERRRRVTRARESSQFTLRDTQRGAVFVYGSILSTTLFYRLEAAHLGACGRYRHRVTRLMTSPEVFSPRRRRLGPSKRASRPSPRSHRSASRRGDRIDQPSPHRPFVVGETAALVFRGMHCSALSSFATTQRMLATKVDKGKALAHGSATASPPVSADDASSSRGVGPSGASSLPRATARQRTAFLSNRCGDGGAGSCASLSGAGFRVFE
jgi:hypothetical protein